ncbi:DNA-(apurinic or apyrimidinic site) lyase APN2 Ecym_6193 [Eremothecium cymbalariae DBVPG|uniref:Endonuclease/exonuclease/phosphatase domain-containing protein n=1 Tax=Eremothecium cymbalariae (strain CBS 270.75 / DBVPG 7215 / KCTC 17166 / NRRL Y-17582) TaxID=931890 RepID=G8JV97_ERECY|nr:hypothetical protein Ecym_6193 [Eremothecium cymbalariae DBVPG\
MDTVHGELKAPNNVRFITFNVNGIRTLFSHYPFSRMNNSLSQLFKFLDGDIITFQELKIDRLTVSKWGIVDDAYSFITIPKVKRGYSGVGCWVRIREESDPLSSLLKVVKAEEGITGLLKVKRNGELVSYRDDPTIGIGGYENLPYSDDAEELDSQGRCVIIELACGIVVISTYCPANSTQTEEGEVFRMKFLKLLFKRVRNLKEQGKEVVLMGDINVSRDLIDKAEALEQQRLIIRDADAGLEFEKKYMNAVRGFIYDPLRITCRMLNEMLADSIIPEFARNGILIDSTRYIQGRNRLKMYTVWNTIMNSRPVNYGSRLDYIFVTTALQSRIRNANIWPQIMGSDHCPVFLDLSFTKITAVVLDKTYPIPKFEARLKYNLNQKNIMDMFKPGSMISFKEKPNLVRNRIAKRMSKNTPNIQSHFDNKNKKREIDIGKLNIYSLKKTNEAQAADEKGLDST